MVFKKRFVGSMFTTELAGLHERHNVDRGSTTGVLNISRSLLSRCRGNVERYDLSFIYHTSGFFSIDYSCLLNRISAEHSLDRRFSVASAIRSKRCHADALFHTSIVLGSDVVGYNSPRGLGSCFTLSVCHVTIYTTGNNCVPGG